MMRLSDKLEAAGHLGASASGFCGTRHSDGKRNRSSNNNKTLIVITIISNGTNGYVVSAHNDKTNKK